MKRILLVLCLIIACFPVSAQAISKIPAGSTVAVVGLGYMGENNSFDNISRENLAKVAKEYISFHLEKQTQFPIVMSDDLAYTMDEQSLALTGEMDDNTAVNLGNSMQADYVLCGNILGVGVDEDSFSTVGVFTNKIDVNTKLHLKLIDTRTGSVIASSIGDGKSGTSSGGTSLPSLVTVFTNIHTPIDLYMWNQNSINGEIVENSVEKAAFNAVENMLAKTGVKGRAAK